MTLEAAAENLVKAIDGMNHHRPGCDVENMVKAIEAFVEAKVRAMQEADHK